MWDTVQKNENQIVEWPLEEGRGPSYESKPKGNLTDLENLK
jgi:hypothetical protein